MSPRLALPLATVLAAALAGCVAPAPPLAFDGAGPAFTPERFFAGRSRFWGVVESTQGGPSTQFEGSLAGRREADGAVQVEESVAFADGTKLARSWRLRQIDNQRIEATGSDIAGVAAGEVQGRMMHLRYAMAAIGGRGAGLDVEHWMYLQDDGATVLNRTVTRRDGSVLRMTTERFVRAGEPPAHKVARIAPASRAKAAAAPVAPSRDGAASAVASAPHVERSADGARAMDDFRSSFGLRR